ncbi:MAG: radical SAM family heme chaperone HemW, partial [Bacteroidales bacterium]|nr:radical SAM family heme chaperone HemW [Bacteroidales bacterium]
LYIHIPFCLKRCAYCDFFSNTDLSSREEVVAALSEELKLRSNYLRGAPVETIYFGGGTPSLLKADDFRLIFETIENSFLRRKYQEITLEANPDDLHPDFLKMLREFSFNRISIGIQSLQNDELKMLNRRHTAEQAIAAVEQCRACGLDNISIDLMYGLPGQTLERWEDTLQRAIQLQVPHISAYHLTYEKGTTLWKQMEKGEVIPVTEETSLAMFQMLIDRLETAGYEHYEISNFALPGKASRHNSSYWRGIPYLGVGPSAHSFDIESRQWNAASISQWLEGIKSGEGTFEREELDEETRYNEMIMTSLRTYWGVSLAAIEQEFGMKYRSYCLDNASEHLKQGTLSLQGDRLKLTREGIFISDSILSDLVFVR